MYGKTIQSIAIVMILWTVSAVNAQEGCIVHTPLPWWMQQLPDENYSNILSVLETNGICPLDQGDTMSFSSEDFGTNPVIGPVEFPPGLWKFTVHTEKSITIEVTEASYCDRPGVIRGLTFGVTGFFFLAAKDGTQELVKVEQPCLVLFNIDGWNVPWTISVENISIDEQ